MHRGSDYGFTVTRSGDQRSASVSKPEGGKPKPRVRQWADKNEASNESTERAAAGPRQTPRSAVAASSRAWQTDTAWHAIFSIGTGAVERMIIGSQPWGQSAARGRNPAPGQTSWSAPLSGLSAAQARFRRHTRHSSCLPEEWKKGASSGCGLTQCLTHLSRCIRRGVRDGRDRSERVHYPAGCSAAGRRTR